MICILFIPVKTKQIEYCSNIIIVINRLQKYKLKFNLKLLNFLYFTIILLKINDKINVIGHNFFRLNLAKLCKNFIPPFYILYMVPCHININHCLIAHFISLCFYIRWSHIICEPSIFVLFMPCKCHVFRV